MPIHTPGYYFVLSEYKPVIGSKQITFRRKNAIIKTTFLGYKSNLICPTCIFWQFACIVPAIFDIDTHDGMSGKRGRYDYIYEQTDKTKRPMNVKPAVRILLAKEAHGNKTQTDAKQHRCS